MLIENKNRLPYKGMTVMTRIILFLAILHSPS